MQDDLVSRLKEEKIEATYDLMRDFAPIAGEILLMQRDRVKNIGNENVGPYLTFLDELIQEAFLCRLYRLNPSARIRVKKTPYQEKIKEDTPVRRNPEETELGKLFDGNDPGVCAVYQTSLDGVKQCTEEGMDFSTGCGISDIDTPSFVFTHSVVYFPVNHFMYAISNLDYESFMINLKTKLPEELPNRIDKLWNLEKKLQDAEEHVKSAKEELASEENKYHAGEYDGEPHPLDYIHNVSDHLDDAEKEKKEIEESRRGLKDSLVEEIASLSFNIDFVKTDIKVSAEIRRKLHSNNRYFIESMLLHSMTE